jgi:hypothetical protein
MRRRVPACAATTPRTTHKSRQRTQGVPRRGPRRACRTPAAQPCAACRWRITSAARSYSRGPRHAVSKSCHKDSVVVCRQLPRCASPCSACTAGSSWATNSRRKSTSSLGSSESSNARAIRIVAVRKLAVEVRERIVNRTKAAACSLRIEPTVGDDVLLKGDQATFACVRARVAGCPTCRLGVDAARPARDPMSRPARRGSRRPFHPRTRSPAAAAVPRSRRTGTPPPTLLQPSRDQRSVLRATTMMCDPAFRAPGSAASSISQRTRASRRSGSSFGHSECSAPGLNSDAEAARSSHGCRARIYQPQRRLRDPSGG